MTARSRVRALLLALVLPIVVIALDSRADAQVERLALYTPPFFPLGMFEDANRVGGDTPAFETMLRDLQLRSLDAVLFTNGSARRDARMLTASDRLGFRITVAPYEELGPQWFDNPTAPATIEAAKRVVAPVVEAFMGHPSLVGYNIIDDGTETSADKSALAVQAFRELDPDRPAMPVIVGGHENVYTRALPRNFLTYQYPALAVREPCDWDFASPTSNGFSHAIRSVTRDKDPRVPLWLILQSHGRTRTVDPRANPTTLREPTVEEVRLQQWIAVGEGAKGIFWFIYDTQQWWRGLKDNPALFDEVGVLAQRAAPLRETLLGLHKIDDRFTVAGSANRYVSTLANADESKFYVVAANASCGQPQTLTPTSSSIRGQLKDLETGQRYDLGAPILFRAGDGKVFELVNASLSGPASSQAAHNLVANASFEDDAGGRPSGWGGAPVNSRDVTIRHNGSASLNIQGPTGFAYAGRTLDLKPDTLYTMSYWTKTQDVSGTGISVRWAQMGGSGQLVGSPWTSGTTDGWRRITMTFYSPVGEANGRLDAMWALGGGAAWIDDLAVCEGRVCDADLASAPSTAPANLVSNGSFEAQDDGYPRSWAWHPNASREAAVAHTGAASLRVQGPSPFTYSYQPLALKADTQYEVSYWVRTENVGGSGLGLRYAQLVPAGPVAEFPRTAGTSGGWKRVTASFRTAGDPRDGRLDIIWDLAGGTAWIDDIFVCEGIGCSSFAP